MAEGAQRFQISETNPNDAIGGGGCLCSEGRCEDRGGPYAVFSHVTTDVMLSPHAVVCAPCIKACAAALDGETIHAGEPTPEPTTPAPVVESRQPGHENPAAEGTYPVLGDPDDDVAI